MNKRKFYISCCCCFVFLCGSTFCLEPVSTSDLLMSYLENDNALKNNAIEAQKAQLALDSTEISNGFDISLSTGDISVKVNGSNTSVSMKPSVKAAIPQASNLNLSAGSDFTFSNSGAQVKDTKLNAAVDIISTAGLSREISLLKAQRNLTEATRKLRNQAINTEKNFYSELKSLLNSTNSLINSEKTLYTNKIDFEKIKAQGYSSGSSTYRLAQMKVLSTEHDIENAKRALIHDYASFYKKCGYDISIEDSASFYDLIPSDITAIDPVDIKEFSADLYSEVESAVWTHNINNMQRKVKTNFTLSANSGVTLFTNDGTSVDAGLSSSYNGLNLGVGVSIPLSKSPVPEFSLSASFSPNTVKQNSITEQTNYLNEKQELLAIETAYTNYENKVSELEQDLKDLLWNQKSDEESLQMYQSLEKDLAKWYREGFVTESEYYSAKVNTQSYTVKKIINAIDLIIYNDNIVTMFVEDIQKIQEEVN